MELRTELVPRHHAILFKSVHVSTGNIAIYRSVSDAFPRTHSAYGGG
jgi:hypothetical protein